MLETKLDTRELDGLIKKLEQAPEVFQQARREAMEQAAPKLLQAVRGEIGGRGKVQRWQDSFVGSKGGYAAARPKKDTFTEPTKKEGHKYAVGLVTNAINSGHRYTGQSVRGKGRRKTADKFTSGRVAGRYFYEAAQTKAAQVAQEAVQQVADTLKSHLEG